ncbi:unnamed protein product (macronuclear) [Paramecium tetraurelia]|uniref:Transmembrane protein n=1 Tax=Paramecium tetraurelia TaxID=5888 RepID=A0BK22_PARTE|nr:uncharacterized protein GSPATT00029519001 [Paramecium tetraurelia]CAK58889.1 unnamed protein product [Paramecium tetraurelia]|eukprot:XP_001426287.1 hypothetical protein (macronuclear) [Paramecium tetraurelia strain d4-2]
MISIKQNFSQFRRLDLFGMDVRLLAHGQQAYRTNLGAFMTLFLFSLLAYSCNSFILEMNKGKNAILNQKESPLLQNEGFSFNSSQFIYAIGMVDSLGQYIPNENNRIFQVSFYYCKKSLLETACEVFPAVICGSRISEAAKQMNVPEDYQYITYCPDDHFAQTHQDIRFQGSQRMDNLTLLGAYIQKCTNSTETQNCAPEEEITKSLSNANLFYSYSFYQFNKELDLYPYEKVQNLDVTPCYPNIRKYIKVFYQYSVTTSEYNPFYFFPSTIDQDAVEYQQTTIDTFLDYNLDNTFAQIEITLNFKKKLNYVTYQTLMDVAAKIGGFFTILKALFYLLLYPAQVIVYRLYLINSLINQQQTFTTLENLEQKDTQTKFAKLRIRDLIRYSRARSTYFNYLKKVERLLDITEVLSNPLRLTRQVEDIQGSIRKFDPAKNQFQVRVALDEIIANQDKNDIQSPRSVNQELQPVIRQSIFLNRLQPK